jgi:hypothetical protein
LTSYVSATFECVCSAGRPLIAWFHEALLSCNEPFYALILYRHLRHQLRPSTPLRYSPVDYHPYLGAWGVCAHQLSRRIFGSSPTRPGQLHVNHNQESAPWKRANRRPYRAFEVFAATNLPCYPFCEAIDYLPALCSSLARSESEFASSLLGPLQGRVGWRWVLRLNSCGIDPAHCAVRPLLKLAYLTLCVCRLVTQRTSAPNNVNCYKFPDMKHEPLLSRV